MYYIYFITPETRSEFICFGQTSALGLRWTQYRTMQPDPKLVGLIECENKDAMLQLEQDIKKEHLKNFNFRNEWLHHTPEVKAFYQAHTNVDIEITLLGAIEKKNEYNREYWREYRKKPERKEYQREYREQPQNKERKRASAQQYEQRPEVKARRQEYHRQYEKTSRCRAYRQQYEQRPEVKARRRQYQREYYQRPEVKARQLEKSRKQYARKKQENAQFHGQGTLFD